MKRSTTILFFLFLIGVLVLSSCAQKPAPVTNEPIKLSMWSRDTDKALVDGLTAAWNSAHENQIEVTYIPYDQFYSKYGTAIAGGTSPDIVAMDIISVPSFSQTNQLTDITEFSKALPFFDKLSPAHMHLGDYKGKIYALPFSAEASVLVYNKDLFTQAGLDPENPPKTWDEMYEAAKKITGLGDGVYGFYFSGGCGGCNGFTMLPLIWANGGNVLNADGTQATVTDPNVKEAVQFYRKMWEENLIPEGAKADGGADFINAFTSGKIGMISSGAFSISLLKSDYPDINFGVTYIPGKDGGHSSFAGGDSIGIPMGSRYPEEAFEFIKWALSEEVQLEQFAKNNQLPVRTDLVNNKYFDADPRLSTSASAMAIGNTPYSVKNNELFNDPNGPWLLMLQTAIFEGNIDGAIEKAQSQFSTMISE